MLREEEVLREEEAGGGCAFGLASPQEMVAELGFRMGRNAAFREIPRVHADIEREESC